MAEVEWTHSSQVEHIRDRQTIPGAEGWILRGVDSEVRLTDRKMDSNYFLLSKFRVHPAEIAGFLKALQNVCVCVCFADPERG